MHCSRADHHQFHIGLTFFFISFYYSHIFMNVNLNNGFQGHFLILRIIFHIITLNDVSFYLIWSQLHFVLVNRRASVDLFFLIHILNEKGKSPKSGSVAKFLSIITKNRRGQRLGFITLCLSQL